MTVHVDRLVKASDRPEHLTVVPSDLSKWIKDYVSAQGGASIAESRDPSPVNESTTVPSPVVERIPEEEVTGSPKVTRKQRSAEQVQRGEWTVDKIVGHKDIPSAAPKGKKKKANAGEMERHYRVRFKGYEEEDDLWYSDDTLRGEGLEAMMVRYDQEQREQEALRPQANQPIAAEGAKRSARLAAKAVRKP